MSENNLNAPFNLTELVNYQDGSIVSRTIINHSNGSLTLFAFDEGQELSEHKTPYDALVQILDGTATITVDKIASTISAGESILMPANIPHAVKAIEKFKMSLTMIKN